LVTQRLSTVAASRVIICVY